MDMGVLKYLIVVVGCLYMSLLVSSYPTLIRWRFLVCECCKGNTEEKKKGGEKEDIFLVSTLFHLGFSHGNSVARNGLFENCRFSQIRR